MADVETLRGLLERVRAATGPDREIDARVDALAKGRTGFVWRLHYYNCDQLVNAGGDDVKKYSLSIDAAFGLVAEMLPGWDLEIDIHALGRLGKGWSTLRGPGFTDADMSQYAQSDGGPKPAPLAILDALLQALIAQAEGGEHA